MYGTAKYLQSVGNVLGKKQPHGKFGYHFMSLTKYFVVPYISVCPQVRWTTVPVNLGPAILFGLLVGPPPMFFDIRQPAVPSLWRVETSDGRRVSGRMG